MSEDLSSNATSCLHLHSHVSHLKWAPMLVVDEVPNQLSTCLSVVLVGWIRYPGLVDNTLLSIRCDVNECSSVGVFRWDDAEHGWCCVLGGYVLVGR